MLGRLFQTAIGLESATDEAHTRSLLFPPSPAPYAYNSLPSPPLILDGSPISRPGSFDDRGELDLDENKDFRVIIAQDASADQDRPVLLFDSNGSKSSPPTNVPNPHLPLINQPFIQATASTTPKSSHFVGSPPPTFTTRNRSSTVSGSSLTGKRPPREVESMEETYLDLMFGATSTTKTGSSTKMHTLIADPSAVVANKAASAGTVTRRSPLIRARTANQLSTADKEAQGHQPSRSTHEDSVLITRVFAVPLEPQGYVSSSAEPVNRHSIDITEPRLAETTDDRNEATPSKRPKLKQTRTPAFAIGVILNLPRLSDGRPSSRHHRSSPPPGYAHASEPSSYGPESQFSWTFLNAIPESLAATPGSDGIADRRLEMVVNSWDIILRGLAMLERESAAIIHKLLRQVDVLSNAQILKTPKAKNEQRSNLRAVRLQPWALGQAQHLNVLCKHVAYRICLGLRIPRVVTGLGFGRGGHWLEEARTISGKMKQQKLFLYNLLTAFLGTHTEWLYRLCPEWHRRRARNKNNIKAQVGLGRLTSRTVIVADQRVLARRMVFLLASFLPRARGSDGLEKDDDHHWSAPPTPSMPTGSPRAPASRRDSLRRQANRRVQESRGLRLDATLSTSASSNEGYHLRGISYGSSSRRGSNDSTVKPGLLHPGQLENGHKTSAGTTETVTPMNPTTPVAYFSRKQDSYFPEGALAGAGASVASADLARILRRGSGSLTDSTGLSTGPSRWGSLLSGVSGFWSNKEETTNSMNTTATFDRDHETAISPSTSDPRPRSRNQLSDMVDQVARLQAQSNLHSQNERASSGQPLPRSRPHSIGLSAEPPKLTVDESDGVIDVDLNLPGFASLKDFSAPLSSPSFGHGPASLTSNDGNDSLKSWRSHAQTFYDETRSETMHVAGFLRKFHPDFTLQAVRPDRDLHQDIRQAMSLESQGCDNNDMEGNFRRDTHDKWVDVSTTLIADMRSSSIQRITLQRNVGAHQNSEAQNSSSSEAHLLADDALISEQRPTSAPHLSLEERFLQELVTDFDETIQQAIQRVLRDSVSTSSPPSGGPHASHSRTASGSTSKSAMSSAVPIADLQELREEDQRRSNCRQIVVGALEEVVKSVNEDLQKTSSSRNAQVDEAKASAYTDPKHENNVLREGVRKWLVSVEQTSVW